MPGIFLGKSETKAGKILMAFERHSFQRAMPYKDGSYKDIVHAGIFGVHSRLFPGRFLDFNFLLQIRLVLLLGFRSLHAYLVRRQ